jgi:hypothetical protein
MHWFTVVQAAGSVFAFVAGALSLAKAIVERSRE